MRNFKKILSFVLIFTFIFSMNLNVFADEKNTKETEITIETINEILRKAKTPENKIKTMDDELKRFIYANTFSKIKTMDGGLKKFTSTNKFSEIEYVEVTEEKREEMLFRSSGYTIPSNKLKLSVTAYKVNYRNQVDIYPQYEWFEKTLFKGKDYFGYSTHSSFSAVPNERSNGIFYKLESHHPWKDTTASYTGTSFTGYEHSNLGGNSGHSMYIKGNFYYRVDINSSNPVKKICLAYVHDTSSGGSVSYGIGYGPLSISITPQSNNVGYQNNIYNLNY